jgi:hypothetical protein
VKVEYRSLRHNDCKFPASQISVMIDCISVAKKRRNITVFVKILSVFWEILTNLTCKGIKSAKVQGILRSAPSTVLSSHLCPSFLKCLFPSAFPDNVNVCIYLIPPLCHMPHPSTSSLSDPDTCHLRPVVAR